ncbi:MAG TPA: NADH-quinone oxidoreductase subunit J [Planctomycetota bacterium]|nr:NADH-quinone oxidoreductase subunit J [Planctomycetota bacterium]
MDFKSTMFYALAAVTLGSGLMVAVARDIVRVAFWLLAALSGVAGLYVTLGADFVGFTQVLVYIGGILVLILFGIMMTNKDPILLRRSESSRGIVAGGFVVAAVVGWALVRVVRGAAWRQAPADVPEPTTSRLGEELLTTFVLPFEVVSVLLLVVLVGAAYVARRRAEET